MRQIPFKPTRILVGVTGGIAAYKSAELIRLLHKTGHSVKVVMTTTAKQFIHPNTFAALSGQPVYGDCLQSADDAMLHITLAKWAERIIIAPTSATTLSKLAHGCADNLLTAICLASEAPCYLAPAMNTVMWHKPVTQDNIQKLRHYGFHILMPEAGEQACGDVGLGRMLAPEQIVQQLCQSSNQLAGIKVVITAGPTQEKIDPVRFISNFSSGKMGYALAQAFINRGADVHLISGPTTLPPPANCRVTQITSATDMHQAVLNTIADTGIFIACAAVADYQPAQMAEQKIKKHAQTLTLRLNKTVDILKAVSQQFPDIFTVGFSAETQDVIANARTKLADKKLNAIVANQIDATGYPFNADTNQLTYITAERCIELPMGSKLQLAGKLIELITKDLCVTT